MKNKKYKVVVEAVYSTTMDHAQKSKEKAINDVKSIVDYKLNNNKEKELFDKPPLKIRYKAIIIDDNQ